MRDRFKSMAAASGIVAVAFWLAGVAVIGGDHVGIPGGVPEEGAEETLRYFREHADRVQAGSWLFMIGSLLLLWFTGLVRGRLRAAEGGSETYAAVAFAGGLATAIFAIGMPAGGLVASLAADRISASTAEALNAVEMVFFLGAQLAAVVLLAASAIGALRTHALPRWLAALGILIAVWLLIAPIGWIALLVGVPIWMIATAVVLIRGPHDSVSLANP